MKSKIPTLNKNVVSGFQSKPPIKTSSSAGKENHFLNAKDSKHSNSESKTHEMK